MLMLQELASQVQEVYAALDAAVAVFAERSGLRCPQGCGHCCLSEKVEATILECLPLAFLLFRTSQAEKMLRHLEEHEGEKPCVLYRPDLTGAGLWGCSQYGTRTVVCRLFGFAGNKDRNGVARLALCRIMKEAGDVGGDIVTIERDVPMPLFVEAGLRITALHPGLGTLRLPINVALHQALLKVGMVLDLQGFVPSSAGQ
jgi:uncharacterized protein